MAKNHKSTILLIRNAAAGDFGGAETYQISLSIILKENDLLPIIVTRSNKLLAAADKAGVKTFRGWWWSRQDWNGKQVALFPFYICWQIVLTGWYITLIWRTKAQALHIQSKDDFIAATIAGRITGRITVWTDHMDLRYIFENISKPLRNPLGKLIFWVGHLAHHIVLISDNEYRLVTSHFKNKTSLERQITLINNGAIDQLDTYQGQAPKNQKDFSFCLASRIVTNKGIGEAIEAFMALKKRVPDQAIRLDIYGDGKDMSHFKELAKNSPSIVFHGHQNDALERIATADVFMLPSYQEGFSIALLEATMLGKAIIASDVDSNPEIIHHHKNGLLVPPRNALKLSDAMLLLLSNHDLRHKFEVAARKDFEHHYDLRVLVIEKIVPLYN